MKNTLKAFLLAFLILSVSATKLRSDSKTLHLAQLSAKKSKGNVSEGMSSAMGAASACYSGFFSNVPPSFCYKKGGDAGKIPTACPDGWHRSLALCYEDCKDGYSFVAGVCWESCGHGYKDLGLTCYKAPFKFKTKHSYIPDSITNFQAPCDDGYYKMGALCYKDCNNIGLVNCGIGACAASSAVCGIDIGSIAINFAASLLQAVAFVASFGADAEMSAAEAEGREAVVKAFQSSSKSGIKEAAKQAVAAINRMGKDVFIKKMIKSAAAKLGESEADAALSVACNAVATQVISNLQTNSDPSNINFQSFDVSGVSSAVSDCQDTSSDANKIQCAQSVMNAVSFVDPTGLVGMAAAFMYPTCSP